MSTDSRPAFLRQLGLGRKRRRDIELADMGTAFGLDLSLDDPVAREAAKAPAASRWWSWLGRKPAA